jgi:hypothetical protein
MWLVGVLNALLAVSAADEPALPPSAQPLPSLATRQTSFSIPFRVDRLPPGSEVVEVQLFVSTDQGNTWQMYQRSAPSAGRFLFQSQGDGEFWFLLKTIDRKGTVRPQNNNMPRLHVVVDTAPPNLKLSATRGEGGQVVLQWQAAEPHPDLNTLKIQYRTPGATAWQAVAIDHRNTLHQPGSQSGQVTWLPQGAASRLEIRAELADAAGNSSVTHHQMNVDEGQAGSVAQQFPRQQQTVGFAGLVPLQPNPPAANQATSPVVDATSSGPLLPITPPMRGGVVTTTLGPSQESPTSSANPRPRVVNTPLFELQYDVESVGPAGIRRVELWGTQDNGRTWTSFGVDDDNHSPMLVSVKEEGIYGFRVAVQTAAGFGSPAPKSGDTPDIWVAVDLTRPNARILSVEQGTGEQLGQVVIRWQAEDRMSAARPISLFVAGTQGGPWTPIATNLENSGQYAWTIDSRVLENQTSDRLFLRMEVRDEAGNLTTVDSNQPISLEQFRPNVRIRDVRPVNSPMPPVAPSGSSTSTTRSRPTAIYSR